MKFLFICLFISNFIFFTQKVLYEPVPGAGFFASFLMTLSNVIWYDRNNMLFDVFWGGKSLLSTEWLQRSKKRLGILF